MPGKRWYQDWLGWVIVISIAYGSICLISLASDVGRPFPGFLTYYNAILTRMEIEWNTPSWWWADTGEHPRLGDVVIQVDDTPFRSITKPVQEAALYQTAWDQGETAVNITIERDNNIITLSVPLETFSWAHYADLMLLPLVIAAAYWLLAIILYRASDGSGKQRLVILILCAIALIGLAIRGTLFISGGWRENILLFINPPHSIAATFIGALLIHLAFRFPFPRWPRLMRTLMPFIYGVAATLYLFFFSAKVTIWRSGITPWAQWMDTTWFHYFQYLIIAGIVFILARMLGETVLVSDKSRKREEARIMLLAFFFFLPAVWFAIHGVSDTNASIIFLQSLADARYLSLVVPFAFAAISLRYHTFAGAERWLFLALILAVSGFLANVGTAVLFWQSPQIIRELPFPPTAVLFFLFLMVSLIWGWQSSWQGWLGRLFNWERINYRAVQQFGHALAAKPATSLPQLAQNITTTLCHELSLECAACWLIEADKMQLSAVNGRLSLNAPPTLSPPPDLSDLPLRLTEQRPEWLRPLSKKVTVILPLFISGKLLGILAVGQRWDAPVFDDRDLEILALISQQAALMLHNTRQTAQLRQTDQQLLHIQKLTRQKTAQNLHDHLLPALSQLQINLLTANQLIHTQPDKAAAMLTESQNALRENTVLVRRIQKDLIVRPLAYGLSPYLQELVNQFNHDTGITTDLHLPAALDTIITHTNMREVIYTVWQQALDNIQQHAQATQVTAHIDIAPGQLTLSIGDNGRGSLPEQQQKAKQNGRFGLRSMQIRLESIDGQFAFHSTLDQGSCVHGQIPLPTTQTPISN
ncbi:MAG: GAF domain-containing protein [Aquificales bacterium]|nr:GAF domain-containing protein [Aquificales bacterium]